MSNIKEAINTPILEKIDQLIEDIYEQRKTGIADGGEYDQRNLLFKEFRNHGYLDNLKELRNKVISKELSLESLEAEQMQEQPVNEKLSLKEYLTRSFMEKEILKVKPYYKLANRSDAEVYNIYRYIQKKVQSEQEKNDMLGQAYFEKNDFKTCEVCGARLNDQNECPVCDLGEEDLLEQQNSNTYTVLWDDAGEIYYTGLTKNVPMIYWDDNENTFATEEEMNQFVDKIIREAGREDEFYMDENLITAKDYHDIREKFYRIIGGGYQPIIQPSGRFDFYNLNETDANYIINRLRGQNFIDYIQKTESGKYNFNAINQFGLPKKYFNVYGSIKE